jgi:hypothetical protein
MHDYHYIIVQLKTQVLYLKGLKFDTNNSVLHYLFNISLRLF